MEPVTVDNGCLFVLPGSHRDPLQRHEYPDTAVNKAYHGIKGYDHRPKVNLLMDKGDTVFFHPQLIHGSGVNVTRVSILSRKFTVDTLILTSVCFSFWCTFNLR